jgi:hypothetical protein
LRFHIFFWTLFGQNTGRFIMFSVITNIYNKKTPNLMELLTATGKLIIVAVKNIDALMLTRVWK